MRRRLRHRLAGAVTGTVRGDSVFLTLTFSSDVPMLHVPDPRHFAGVLVSPGEMRGTEHEGIVVRPRTYLLMAAYE